MSRIDFPNLADVSGGAIIETKSNNDTICDLFNQAKQSQIIKGTVVCQTSVSDTQGNSTTSADGGISNGRTVSGDSKDELSAGVIVGIVLGGSAVVAVLVAVSFLVYRRRKLNTLTAKGNNDGGVPLPDCQQLPSGRHHEKIELYVDPKSVVELNGINGHGRTVPGLYEIADTSMTSPTSTMSMNDAAFGGEHIKAVPLEKL